MASEPPTPATLVQKIWTSHLAPPGTRRDVVVVDRILLHERQVGMLARHPVARQLDIAQRVIACADQQVPTGGRDDLPRGAQHVAALERLERDTDALGVPVFGPGDPRSGIVNVVAAEQGMVRPGALVVGADAHVATLGALGALALRLSDDEVAEVVATGKVQRSEPVTVRVSIAGRLEPWVSAKDLALWLLARLGPIHGADRVIELAGPVVRSLGTEARMTLCNLTCESEPDAVIVAPDRETATYLAGRPFVPVGPSWRDEVDRWSALASDGAAELDGDVVVVADGLGPWVTWGTRAWQAAPLDGLVPAPHRDPRRARLDEQALQLQGLRPGTPLADIDIDQVFIGSCANARLDDLRAAAKVAKQGRAQVRSWVVPGSWVVKRQAEAEGLHRVFLDAGFEWRDPGCSLCIGANGDAVAPGTRVASTANRPENGRVGPRSQVHILSPESAVATAFAGRLRSAEAR
jgi:3-isopropylmalate/(R)-2-methylmalate dehydratase large subunit